MSAIGDIYGHPMMTVKHSSPDVSITTTTTTTTRQVPYQREALDKTFLEATIGVYSTKLFPSTIYRIEGKKIPAASIQTLMQIGDVQKGLEQVRTFLPFHKSISRMLSAVVPSNIALSKIYR